MSWQTQNWAGEQRGVSPQAKLILIGLASCSDANHCAYPSVGWLIEWSGLERKTVLKWLSEMSDTKDGTVTPLIEDTGQRKGRSLQIKVWRLKVGGADDLTGAAGDLATLEQPKNGIIPKTGPSQKRDHPKNAGRPSQKRDTEPYYEPIPPLSAKADKTPTSDDQDTKKAQRLPDDWVTPAMASLPPMAAQLVRHWPSGAYEAVCETFRLHWHSENRAIGRKRDWTAALAKWLINDHAKVMRDAKAGVSFAALAPSPASATRQPVPPVVSKSRENTMSAALHAQLRAVLGHRVYSSWVEPCALIWPPDGPYHELRIICPNAFSKQWLEDHFNQKIYDLAAKVAGLPNIECRYQIGAIARKDDHGQEEI